MGHYPVCRITPLSKVLLASNLPAFGCPQCEGEWIKGILLAFLINA